MLVIALSPWAVMFRVPHGKQMWQLVLWFAVWLWRCLLWSKKQARYLFIGLILLVYQCIPITLPDFWRQFLALFLFLVVFVDESKKKEPKACIRKISVDWRSFLVAAFTTVNIINRIKPSKSAYRKQAFFFPGRWQQKVIKLVSKLVTLCGHACFSTEMFFILINSRKII